MKIEKYNTQYAPGVIDFIVTCKSEKWKQAIEEELEMIEKIETSAAFAAFAESHAVIGFISIWKTGNVYFISWMNSKDDDESILRNLLGQAIEMAKENRIAVINTTVEQDYMGTLLALLRLGFRITGYTRHRFALDEDELQLSYLL